jgi:hypothetical protein
MGIGTLWSRKEEETPSPKTMSMAELSDYDIISVHDEPGMQFAVVSARGSNREIGTSSPSPWTSFERREYNPALMGIRGYEMYDKMRKSDGTISGTLLAIKMGALSGRWFISPAKPYGDDDPYTEDDYREASEWVWCNLMELMSISWTQVLTEALLMCDFGNYMFEKVWENKVVRGKMRTVLTKLGPRHPMDVQEWVFDSHGGPLRVIMNPPSTADFNTTGVPIDIEKLLVFTFKREAGNIEGISVLRTAYKHWYFMEQLYKIDAIQKERHGIGIPVIELPMGYKDEDKLAAEDLGRNIRTNERAHITLPPGWKIYMLKMEGQPVDSLESIQHHQEAIRENILVNFVTAGAREEDLVMFFKASRFVADIVADTINSYLVPQMIKYNYPGMELFPKLKVRRIGETADWRTLTFALRNLVGAGIVIPDEDLEYNIREEMDLPALNKDNARLIATPQNPFDVNEDELTGNTDLKPGDPGYASQKAPASDDSETIHNRNNPRYNRKLKRGRKQNGQQAGLPRQALPGKQRNLPGRQGGSDRSGG